MKKVFILLFLCLFVERVMAYDYDGEQVYQSNTRMIGTVTQSNLAQYDGGFCAPIVESYKRDLNFGHAYQTIKQKRAGLPESYYLLGATAAEEGRVVFVGWSLMVDDYIITLSHGDSYYTTYTYSEHGNLVSCGDNVKKGDLLGLSETHGHFILTRDNVIYVPEY